MLEDIKESILNFITSRIFVLVVIFLAFFSYTALFRKAWDMAVKEGYDLLVIDEFMSAYNHGLIEQKQALECLMKRPDCLEVVLTGRNPGEELLKLADYVTEMKKIKHPFDQGIYARKGIEY